MIHNIAFGVDLVFAIQLKDYERAVEILRNAQGHIMTFDEKKPNLTALLQFASNCGDYLFIGEKDLEIIENML